MTESKIEGTLTLRLHVWFERDEKIFLGNRAGPFCSKKIEECGSPQAGGHGHEDVVPGRLGQAQGRPRKASARPLVQKIKGKGQRYELTPIGRQLARQFSAAAKRHRDSTPRARPRIFSERKCSTTPMAYPETKTFFLQGGLGMDHGFFSGVISPGPVFASLPARFRASGTPSLLPLEDCLGRVLAEDILSGEGHPGPSTAPAWTATPCARLTPSARARAIRPMWSLPAARPSMRSSGRPPPFRGMHGHRHGWKPAARRGTP